MAEHEGEIIVGLLGQWASGKSTAASTLVRYLGGEGEVVFITDRELFAGQAVNHILELKESSVTRSTDEVGIQRLEGELATVYLGPEEDLNTVDLNMLNFDLRGEVFDNVAQGSYSWLDRARLELGYQILERSAEGKPIVVEAGFGTNTEPRGENPFSHTIPDLFVRSEEAGVDPEQVKWIIIEAAYEKRSARNRKRKDSVPAVEFDRFAADGGDIDPAQEKSWVEKGISIKRVSNNHEDVQQFRDDIIAAFEELFNGVHEFLPVVFSAE